MYHVPLIDIGTLKKVPLAALGVVSLGSVPEQRTTLLSRIETSQTDVPAVRSSAPGCSYCMIRNHRRSKSIQRCRNELLQLCKNANCDLKILCTIRCSSTRSCQRTSGGQTRQAQNSIRAPNLHHLRSPETLAPNSAWSPHQHPQTAQDVHAYHLPNDLYVVKKPIIYQSCPKGTSPSLGRWCSW